MNVKSTMKYLLSLHFCFLAYFFSISCAFFAASSKSAKNSSYLCICVLFIISLVNGWFSHRLRFLELCPITTQILNMHVNTCISVWYLFLYMNHDPGGQLLCSSCSNNPLVCCTLLPALLQLLAAPCTLTPALTAAASTLTAIIQHKKQATSDLAIKGEHTSVNYYDWIV